MPKAAGLYYEEHGPSGAPPLILSPGLGGSAAYWAPNLDALAADHRIILYDHRGTGRSDRTLPRNLSVKDMADDVLLLMDGLGLASASLIGHAGGGVIGLSLALSHPERLERLVVINGWSRPDPHFARCMETRLALLHDSGVAAFVRAQPIFLYPANWISEHSADLDAEEAGQIAHFQGVANIEARIAALTAFDIDSRLGEIHTPTLIVCGAADILVPSTCSERLFHGLADAMFAEMLSGGHACNVTLPRSFNDILSGWWAGGAIEGVQ